MEEVLKYLKDDIFKIMKENTNKVPLLKSELFKTNHEYYRRAINEEINYIVNNDEVLQLCIEAFHAGNLHDYKIVTDRNYRKKHIIKYDHNCPDCKSYDIIDEDRQITCSNCGLVLRYKFTDIGYIEWQNYNKYPSNIYKRMSYVNILIDQKLPDISSNHKERIICEIKKILTQFNKTNKNNRKSFYSYSCMFRYVLNKLKLVEYIGRFQNSKTKATIKTNEEFYSAFN